MTQITNAILEEYKARGLLSSSRHPTLPLSVWCYTRSAQFDRAWDEVTMAARGLVLHDDGRVIGRGLPKFFAYGDPLCEVRPAPFIVYEKMDGSLIHVTEYEGELITWTKASFATEHAEAALEYLKGWMPNPGTTALFEGIFGFNRVVVNYGSFRGLVLLGEVHNESGYSAAQPEWVADETGWPGEIARQHRFFNVEEMARICADPDNGTDREGFVALWDDGHRIKVKFAKYLTLHKTMTNLTHRRVHEMFLARLTEADGAQLWEEFLDQLPDEMDAAVQAIVDDIVAQAEVIYDTAAVGALMVRIFHRDHGPDYGGARQSAAKIFGDVPEYRKYLWLAYDGKWETLAIQCVRSIEMPVMPVLAIEDDA